MEKDYLKVYLSGEIHSDWRDVIKKKVSDILKENSFEKDVKVLEFIRYKVGEGV